MVSLLTISTALATVASLASAQYTPVTYASSAIVDNNLYIYGGLTKAEDYSSSDYSNQFLSLSLSSSFDTDDIPWKSLPGTIKTSSAPAIASMDGKRFMLGGSRNNNFNAPLNVYDLGSGSWTAGPDLPIGNAGMANYRRNSPGMTLDTVNGYLIEFGGFNTQLTTELNIMDTNQPTGSLTWGYNGNLTGIPALFAPTMVYIESLQATMIFGGCTRFDGDNDPIGCSNLNTVYFLSSTSAASANPTASKITTKGPTPPSRLAPCTVITPDGNMFMLGGGDPSNPLGDAWSLNTQTWTWSNIALSGAPRLGIMGHTCQMGKNNQILVIGGHRGTSFVDKPISVIRTTDWTYITTYHYGVSTGVKAGMGVSCVVVIGAIAAGLFIRRRRNQQAHQKSQFEMHNPESQDKIGHHHLQGDSDHHIHQDIDAHSLHYFTHSNNPSHSTLALPLENSTGNNYYGMPDVHHSPLVMHQSPLAMQSPMSLHAMPSPTPSHLTGQYHDSAFTPPPPMGGYSDDHVGKLYPPGTPIAYPQHAPAYSSPLTSHTILASSTLHSPPLSSSSATGSPPMMMSPRNPQLVAAPVSPSSPPSSSALLSPSGATGEEESAEPERLSMISQSTDTSHIEVATVATRVEHGVASPFSDLYRSGSVLSQHRQRALAAAATAPRPAVGGSPMNPSSHSNSPVAASARVQPSPIINRPSSNYKVEVP